MKRQRCAWAGADPLMVAYHDDEWGVPQHEDRRLFEFLVLEGAQAGLSWSTILNKREAYRDCFDGFDPQRVARYSSRRIASLLTNAAIVRNRAKIASAVSNAQAVLELRSRYGSFDAYIWSFAPPRRRGPIQHREDVPAATTESDAMSKALKRLGFRFVGSTICYAFMQAVGMVNDHTADCFRYRQIAGRGA